MAVAEPDAGVASFGLSQAALSGLRSVLAQHPEVRRAVVFGSRAKGNFRPGSDIDLALDAPGLPFEALLRIEQQIDDLLLPYETDLVLMTQIESQPLLDHIARVGMTLWQGP